MNIFKCKPLEVHFNIKNRVPYNKLLTTLACSSRTGEYWPSVAFIRAEHTTLGQYSPVRPSRSVRGYNYYYYYYYYAFGNIGN